MLLIPERMKLLLTECLTLVRWVLQVRPNAVALVDAFDYTDHYLSSVLGRYDGNVYPALYEEAWKDPLNETVVPDGYQEHLRPLLKQQLKLSRL
jgi:acyl-CoA oxidase